VEAEEEAISNKFERRLAELKQEKEKLMQAVEREEEHLSNTLQAKLLKLQKEKVDLENQVRPALIIIYGPA
jgi:hypothetical protein